MSILPWGHHRPLVRRNDHFGLQNDINQLFNDFFEGSTLPSLGQGKLMPAMDVIESDKSFKITAEMPGMDADDIDISVNNNTLSIHGEKKTCKEERNDDDIVVRSERTYGSYQRTLSLPENADLANIDASFKKGVLHLEVPKTTTEAESRKIKVKQVD